MPLEVATVTVTSVLTACRGCDSPACSVKGRPNGLFPWLVVKLNVIPLLGISLAPTKDTAPPLGIQESSMPKSPSASTTMVNGAQPTVTLRAGVGLTNSPEI